MQKARFAYGQSSFFVKASLQTAKLWPTTQYDGMVGTISKTRMDSPSLHVAVYECARIIKTTPQIYLIVSNKICTAARPVALGESLNSHDRRGAAGGLPNFDDRSCLIAVSQPRSVKDRYRPKRDTQLSPNRRAKDRSLRISALEIAVTCLAGVGRYLVLQPTLLIAATSLLQTSPKSANFLVP